MWNFQKLPIIDWLHYSCSCDSSWSWYQCVELMWPTPDSQTNRKQKSDSSCCNLHNVRKWSSVQRHCGRGGTFGNSWKHWAQQVCFLLISWSWLPPCLKDKFSNTKVTFSWCRMLAQYLGEDQMLAIVCRDYAAAQSLDANTFHKLAGYNAFCLEDIR